MRRTEGESVAPRRSDAAAAQHGDEGGRGMPDGKRDEWRWDELRAACLGYCSKGERSLRVYEHALKECGQRPTRGCSHQCSPSTVWIHLLPS
mgnify:CR=1 FL=1